MGFPIYLPQIQPAQRNISFYKGRVILMIMGWINLNTAGKCSPLYLEDTSVAKMIGHNSLTTKLRQLHEAKITAYKHF